jgi:hypothetical protein
MTCRQTRTHPLPTAQPGSVRFNAARPIALHLQLLHGRGRPGPFGHAERERVVVKGSGGGPACTWAFGKENEMGGMRSGSVISGWQFVLPPVGGGGGGRAGIKWIK